MPVTESSAPLKLRVEIEKWPLQAPFRITGHTFVEMDVVVVTLSCNGHVGRGEAAGVYYRKETAQSMVAQIEAARAAIEAGIDRDSLQRLLPAGGARNAVDCAVWDLEAQLCGLSAWKIAGLNAPVPLVTTFTISADDPSQMARTATSYGGAQAIKLKLTGEPIDAERVKAVRSERPEVWLGVDANQGFTPESLRRLLPVLVDARVSLIEQPFPVGREADLEGLRAPIPIAADESVQDTKDIVPSLGRFDVINIKLDKSGGLTEALAMARQARQLGLEVMVGNMTGTALAMAPGFLVGQLCQVVDLDGPIFLRNDRTPGVVYEDPAHLKRLGDALKEGVPAAIYPPGTMPAYSNYGAALAGYIVARVSGVPFEEYVEQHIFQPLHMEHSTFRQPVPETLRPYVSNGYLQASGKVVPFEYGSDAPAGALSATAPDMAKFMLAHLNGGALGWRVSVGRTLLAAACLTWAYVAVAFHFLAVSLRY